MVRRHEAERPRPRGRVRRDPRVPREQIRRGGDLSAALEIEGEDMKVQVDQSVCREYANCVMESPDVFDIDEEKGKAFVIVEQPDASLHEEVRAAVASCPVHAITLVE
ncbi:ferredoxin [Georgenia sp. Z1491]|uniref:ferredoxin n=1 Tax=Georgenia sp. Z1491 TaxID=3416707 RepID=UPI003CF1B68B